MGGGGCQGAARRGEQDLGGSCMYYGHFPDVIPWPFPVVDIYLLVCMP